MRSALLLYFILLSTLSAFAQAPVLQWQKNFGGSLDDYGSDFKVLADGNFIMLGSSDSNNGDITGNHGSSDVCVIKSDVAGNILWQKSYGGTFGETASAIVPTTDGGFILVGCAHSNDGDVTGHHGISGYSDVWVVKLNASGNITWQRSYGGIFRDEGADIVETAGGFIISGQTLSVAGDGDIATRHGTFLNYDLWVFKIDFSGNIIWRRCYGGSGNEGAGGIYTTRDGAFILTATTESSDGDVSNHLSKNKWDLWVLKISSDGTIIWDKCIGGNDGDNAGKVIENSDGSFFMVGGTESTDLPGSFPKPAIPFPPLDAWALLLDASGELIWQKAFGGTGGESINNAVKTADGGYLLFGSTESADGIVCPKHLLTDVWLVKMDAAGNIQWNRTYGGSKYEFGLHAILIPSGDCVLLSGTYSNDGDIANSKGAHDFWLTRYSFTGPLIYPAVTISADTDTIGCAGNTVQFVAVPVDGGTAPSYQWKLNGVNIGPDNDTILLNNIYENDLVSCVLTSNSNCVDVHTITSNSVTIKTKIPASKNFLPQDTALCSYEKIELRSNKKFTGYLWSNGSTAESITVKKPGLYWLDVADNLQCLGTDSIRILPRRCIEGVFVPTAFTPNKDSKNDVFRPVMHVDVKQFRFTVFDRWGKVVFETTTLNKGWDGTLKGMPYNTGVFAWQCIYQLEGEAPASKRGTVLLLR